MNRKALITLISLTAGAASLVPAAAFADKDNGLTRDRQEESRSEQRDSRRDAERQTLQRQQTERPAVQRTEPRDTRQLRSQPRAEQRTAPRVERNDRRIENRNAVQRTERRDRTHVERNDRRVERNDRRVERNDRRVERPARQVERRSIERHRSYVPERRHIETRRSYHVERPHTYREHYVYRPVPRDRYYFGIHIYRHYGHRYPGFGFYYSDHDALRFLAFTALTLAIINQVDEHAQRLHEQAMVRATTAEVGDTVYWDEGRSYGSVTVTDIWYDRRGRECRELEQSVTSHGNTETSYSTVCKKRDGIWVVPAQ